jgi:hypothetical protein
MTGDVLPNSRNSLPTSAPEVDFALVLSRTIEELRNDPSQLRSTIYELARVKLQRAAWQRDPPVDIVELRHLMAALETAIERVEVHSARQDEVRALQSLARMIESAAPKPAATSESHPIVVIDQAPDITGDDTEAPAFLVPPRRVPRGSAPAWSWSGAAPLLRASIVVILVIVACVILDRQLAVFGGRAPPTVAEAPPTAEKIAAAKPKAAAPAQAPVILPPAPPYPLPSVYGVYAVSNGELNELEALVGTVPDQKVFMSAPIKTPSRTVLPDGRIVFIAFRRDIASSAPERVQIRVIARVMRAMTFNTAGKASTTAVSNTWAVRGTSYEYRVAPLSDNPEMLLIRPENPDFALPAGRYGLVLKGLAYDFTVDGRITEAAQCLERTEAANGTFYSECRNR